MEIHRCCATDPVVKAELEQELKSELAKLPSEEKLAEMSKLFHALSHPIRLRMALLLLNSDRCVCELVQLLQKKQNLVSHHLAVMRRCRLITPYMKANWKYYKLRDPVIHLVKGLVINP